MHKSRRGKDQRKGFSETGYAQLLDAAHQQLACPLVVIWDNLNSHVSAAMTELIQARDWLTVCQLPPYAHELKPVGLVWSHLKRSLASLAQRNLAQLTALMKTRLRRMQYRPTLLEGFLASTGLDLTPLRNLTIRDRRRVAYMWRFRRAESSVVRWNSPGSMSLTCCRRQDFGRWPTRPGVTCLTRLIANR